MGFAIELLVDDPSQRMIVWCELLYFAISRSFQGSKVVIEFVVCPGNPLAKYILTFQFLSKRHQNQVHWLS